MSVQPTDIAVLLISLAACIYCFILSRKLERLQNTKDGLGATIVAFSESISAMAASSKETRTHVAQMAARLPKLIEEANSTCQKIEMTRARLEEANTDIIGQVNNAHNELNLLTCEALDSSRKSILEMRTLMKAMQEASEARNRPRFSHPGSMR